MAFSSLSDQWERRKSFTLFHFSKLFLYKITASFTVVIKRSLGGESARDGRSTSKSTCADLAWSLTAWFGDRPASGMSKLSAGVNSDLGNGSFWLEIPHTEHVDGCSWNMREFDRINWPLTSEMFTFLDMRAMLVSEAVSVPTFVLGGLLRLVKACLEISAIRNVWAACSQPRDCAMKKWCMFDQGQWWFLWAERRAGLSSACLNTGTKLVHMREAANNCCCLLSFVVVAGVSCLATVRNVGAGEEHWFWGVQTPHSGRARNAWHSPREGSIVCQQLYVSRQNPATRMSLADQVAYEPTRLGLCVHGQLRSCNSWVEDLHGSATC